jgi:hypothetical protein
VKRTDPQLKLRLPLELKEKIEGEARRSGKPVSHEIIERLERSFVADARMEQDHETRLRGLEDSMTVMLDAHAKMRAEVDALKEKLKAKG